MSTCNRLSLSNTDQIDYLNMYRSAIVALLALSGTRIVAAQPAAAPTTATGELSCGDIPDLISYCTEDCGDSKLKDVGCGAYGADCFCINADGVVENTNINAPLLCDGSDVNTVCEEVCGKVTLIDDFSCKGSDVKCVCAPPDGIPGVGDDAIEDEYVVNNDALAQQQAEELLANPNPAPPTLLENGTIVPSEASTIAEEVAAVSPAEAPAEAPASAGVYLGGSAVLAVAASAIGFVIA